MVGNEEYCGSLAVLWVPVREPGSVKTATV